MAKKQLSAKEILVDINNGMSDEELMTKYGISLEGLQSVFKKLMEARVLTQAMLDDRNSEVGVIVDTPTIPQSPLRSALTHMQTAQTLDTRPITDIQPYYITRFAQMEKEKRTVGFNLYGLVFGPLWYFYKGMWQKALCYMVVLRIFLALLHLVHTIFGLAIHGALARDLTLHVFYALMANWDYYLYKLHGERFFTRRWWSRIIQEEPRFTGEIPEMTSHTK